MRSLVPLVPRGPLVPPVLWSYDYFVANFQLLRKCVSMEMNILPLWLKRFCHRIFLFCHENFFCVSQKCFRMFLPCSFLSLWWYRLSSFQMGGTKVEIFLPKNQQTQRKLLNWVNGEMSKSAKTCQNLTFKVNFLFKISS